MVARCRRGPPARHARVAARTSRAPPRVRARAATGPSRHCSSSHSHNNLRVVFKLGSALTTSIERTLNLCWPDCV